MFEWLTWSNVGAFLVGVGATAGGLAVFHYKEWWARKRQQRDQARYFRRTLEAIEQTLKGLSIHLGPKKELLHSFGSSSVRELNRRLTTEVGDLSRLLPQLFELRQDQIEKAIAKEYRELDGTTDDLLRLAGSVSSPVDQSRPRNAFSEGLLKMEIDQGSSAVIARLATARNLIKRLRDLESVLWPIRKAWAALKDRASKLWIMTTRRFRKKH